MPSDTPTTPPSATTDAEREGLIEAISRAVLSHWGEDESLWQLAREYGIAAFDAVQPMLITLTADRDAALPEVKRLREVAEMHNAACIRAATRAERFEAENVRLLEALTTIANGSRSYARRIAHLALAGTSGTQAVGDGA